MGRGYHILISSFAIESWINLCNLEIMVCHINYLYCRITLIYSENQRHSNFNVDDYCIYDRLYYKVKKKNTNQCTSCVCCRGKISESAAIWNGCHPNYWWCTLVEVISIIVLRFVLHLSGLHDVASYGIILLWCVSWQIILLYAQSNLAYI